MADQTLIRRWLTQLGRATMFSISPAEAAEYLDTIAPMLATRFEDGAFTAVSLEEIAAQCSHLPTYGELVPLLTAWRRENKLTFGMLLSDHRAYEPEPQRRERTPEELDHVTQLVNETVAMLRSNEAKKNAYYAKRPADSDPPLRSAATAAHAEVKRGPVLDE